MQAIFLFGHKTLCNGYVTKTSFVKYNILIMKNFLCDGHVTGTIFTKRNMLIIYDFLCDAYVIKRINGL